MNKTIKKIACAALCAVMLFCMAVPAFADRSTSFSYTTMHNGAQVYRVGSISGSTASASMTLSFLPNVNHLPPSDYSTAIIVIGYTFGGQYLGEAASGSPCGMYCSESYTAGSKMPLRSATCKFFLDPNPNFNLYPLSTQTPDYTDALSK
jgi:hypothetical protein